eukprot:3833814-Rhodomonas_salina.2
MVLWSARACDARRGADFTCASSRRVAARVDASTSAEGAGRVAEAAEWRWRRRGGGEGEEEQRRSCLLYTSPSPRDRG